jgi:nucleotide-binding universal stress UspA family protein
MSPLTVDPRNATGPATGEAATRPVVLREVLFPSDLSEASDGAFGHARFIAEAFGARLTLYHALEVPGVQGGVPPDTRREALGRAQQAVDDFLNHRAERLAVAHAVKVERTTSVHRALVTLVGELQPDLVVMATHGRAGFSHMVLGSVTERVVREARRPVLCVREPEHGVALPYRRVLVPTDLSASSRHAFPMAALLARAFGAEVLALHAVRRSTLASLSGVPEMVEAVPEEAAVRTFVAPDFDGLRLAPIVKVGAAWEAIVETARSERADLVVMSTHGHDSVADRILGSQAERVLRHSPCPVLVTW